MSENALVFRPPRLPYPAAVEKKYGVDIGTWKVLVEAVWPAAQSIESVGLALAYCKARHLDPLKRCVHIVPLWDSKQRKVVETLWPGIAEVRTTASRTKGYAGQDPAVYGPDIKKVWQSKDERIELTVPEWCQVTVYRMVQGVRCAFTGPRVYWLEEYTEKKGGLPNDMWQKRPRGQITKCGEAAALRVGFPEELGDEHTIDSGPVLVQYGQNGVRSEQLTCRSSKLLQEVERVQGDDGSAVHESGQDQSEPTGLPGRLDDSGRDVPPGGLGKEQRKGGGISEPASVAPTEPTDSGGDGPVVNETPLADLEMPPEYMYWCPRCELGFDYDKETTSKKVKNTTIPCCPQCRGTDLQPGTDL